MILQQKSKNKWAIIFAQWFVGLLFIFSGLIKANDPLGFGYKLQEYFDVFKLSFLNDYATGFAIIICSLEIVLGILLLFGLYIRKVSAGLLILIIFFTFLTFVSAAFNVVTSCGCFGDAIPLTPWESFGKDVILLILILYIFKQKAFISPLVNSNMGKKVAYAAIAISLLFGIYTWSYLPIVDFLPYKVGANIPKAMEIPVGAPVDEFQILYNLKNKKTGEEKKISDAEYISTGIWEDDNWEIVGDPDKKLIKKGFQQKIKDLIIVDGSTTNYTKELIENPYYNLIIVAYNLSETNENAIGRLNALAINSAEQFNIRTVLLTSTGINEAEKFTKENKLFPEIFYADGVPLKSMVRANPGLLLLKNGTIINKWHHNNLPTFKELSKEYFSKQ